MSKLIQLIEQAEQKNEMKWRVYAYDPAKDNKLVHSSKQFDNINDAGICKAEWLKDHPSHTIEVIAESANIEVKNAGILEVPQGKNVEDLPLSHFENLVKKHDYASIARALINLEVWNKDKNKSLSKWASDMHDKLKEKFRMESAQKNEDGTSWNVQLELRAPSSMNNKALEDKLEKLIETNGITVLDVTAVRK